MGLIGAVIRVLEDEGLHLRDSTWLLKPLLASEGAMTRRRPDKDEPATSITAAASRMRSPQSM